MALFKCFPGFLTCCLTALSEASSCTVARHSPDPENFPTSSTTETVGPYLHKKPQTEPTRVHTKHDRTQNRTNHTRTKKRPQEPPSCALSTRARGSVRQAIGAGVRFWCSVGCRFQFMHADMWMGMYMYMSACLYMLHLCINMLIVHTHLHTHTLVYRYTYICIHICTYV